MKIIGLTGGIASGKSTVAKYLRELGAQVIDADEIAREVVLPEQPAYRDIVREFGREILLPDGTLNRQKLGSIIFKNPAARKKLDQITHPAIYREIERQVEEYKAQAPEGLVFLDVPLLIETGMHEKVDEVWLTFLPEELQLQRLMERDGFSKSEGEKRLSSQLPLREKIKFAHRVIDTSGLLEETRKQVVDCWEKISQD
ncbi:MAG: dephospho-CoA kinase [Dehalobacterium sp.]